MKLICSSCAYFYELDATQLGSDDVTCSATPRGVLREPTEAEAVLFRRFQQLHKQFQEQAKEIARLYRDHSQLFQELA